MKLGRRATPHSRTSHSRETRPTGKGFERANLASTLILKFDEGRTQGSFFSWNKIPCHTDKKPVSALLSLLRAGGVC